MKRNLDVSSVIELKNNNSQTAFRIEEVVGLGGSCVAYKVSYCESEDIVHTGILKEFCPAYLDGDNSFRRDGQKIVIADENKEQFSYDLEKFVQVYKEINSYLSKNLSAANYHTVQMGLYEGNNTFYTLTSCDYGKSYDKVTDSDIYTVLKLMLAVSKAVELYHDAGYLHLDIKPKNVLILDEVSDIVKLFDFDSLTPIDAFKGRECFVPVPEDYYVPELANFDIRNIGVQTDIFEIGAMLFSRLFGRAPEIREMQHGYEFDLDSCAMLTGISPQAKYELQQILSKTIRIAKPLRYKKISELKNQLSKVIALVSPNGAPYLLDLPRWQPSIHSVGRDDELREIKSRLDNDGYVFIKAIGGLGKSEIAKQFAKRFSKEYHTVQFCKYNDSLSTLVASMPVNGINDDQYTDVDKLAREKNKVLHLCDQHTLIIVDNFNVTHDDFLRDFLPSNNKSFKVIFTTRCTLSSNYYNDKIYELPHLSLEYCKYLFSLHYGADLSTLDQEQLQGIIETIDYNTLVLVLIASALKRSGASLEEMLQKLKNQELDDVQTKVFHEYDFSEDEIETYNKINAHLNAVFSVDKLTDVEREILKNMTLIPHTGMSLNDFVECCESESIDENVIDNLINHGWIIKNTDGMISLHSIISDILAADKTIEKKASYYNLAEQIEDYCNPDYLSHISVVMSRLAFAIQLQKRYRAENDEKLLLVTIKLGRLYANVYRPDEARKYLADSLELAQNSKNSKDLADIYYYMGGVEKDFGSLGEAIKCFELSIKAGQNIKNRCYYTVYYSMFKIADCLADNQETEKAYKQYKEALRFAKTHFLKIDYFDIYKELAEVCNNLDWVEKAEKYNKLCEKHKSLYDESLPEEILEIAKLSEAYDYEKALETYEAFLAQKREELGEDSPVYKDFAKSRWTYYAAIGDKENATRIVAETLDFIKETYGEESIEMAKELSLIAGTFITIDELAYALESAEKAIEICEKIGENDSFVCIEAKTSLVTLSLVFGKIDEAKAMLENIDLNRFTGNEILSTVVNSVGIVMCDCGEYEMAEEFCQMALSRKNMDLLTRTQASLIMARINLQRGFVDEAEKYITAAHDNMDGMQNNTLINQWFILYYRTAAELLAAKGDYEGAISKLNEYLDMLGDKKTGFFTYSVILEKTIYYGRLGDHTKFKEGCENCENILQSYNMPKERYVELYNLFIKLHIETGNFAEAKKYCDKIVAAKPTVFNSVSLFDAVLCCNLGWVEYNLGELEKAESLMLQSVEIFEKIGAKKSSDYLTVLSNLALVYSDLGCEERFFEVYREIFLNYDSQKDVTGSRYLMLCAFHQRGMLQLELYNQALTYAKITDEFFVDHFGECSPRRIELLILLGDNFKQHGFDECVKYFKLADDAIEKGGFRNTVYDAKIKNYFGVCLADIEKEYDLALRRFKESKEIFEKANAEDDPAYPVVLSNIEYARSLSPRQEHVKSDSLGDQYPGSNSSDENYAGSGSSDQLLKDLSELIAKDTSSNQ